jgi:MerR family mercuric resistance operon transcriptional regulator
MSVSGYPKSGLTIGRLAKAADVNVETIRYYQRIGLIEEPAKPANGFRKYPANTIEQIKFVKRAQQLGFSLQEVSDLISIGSGRCRDVRVRAEEKRNKIDKQIRDLQALRKTLDLLISECADNDQQQCPIIETLLAQE